jgi:hypothetical protein
MGGVRDDGGRGGLFGLVRWVSSFPFWLGSSALKDLNQREWAAWRWQLCDDVEQTFLNKQPIVRF